MIGYDIKIKNECVNVRCAIICVGCDIPASRKLCGFLGINFRNVYKKIISFSYVAIKLTYNSNRIKC